VKLVFERETGHEQVVFCRERCSGLKAIIAIYSTALGPALGGTRFYPYRSEEAALTDVLALARAMAYKSALAGLALGGGKAVIIGDPTRDKSPAVLRAYGSFVARLGGQYITACDVGTESADMDVVAEVCPYTTGRSERFGGAGDSSVLTAYGVLMGMRAVAERLWGVAGLRGRRVGVEGVGKVGGRLVDHLVSEGCAVAVFDVDRRAVERVTARHPGVATVPDRATLVGSDIDVYAPCALGGTLTVDLVDALGAKLVCGGANNQLADDGAGKRLAERGIVYLPDFLVNAGGLIQVADEIHGFDHARARWRAGGIYDTTKRVLRLAEAEGLLPVSAAQRLAERRMHDNGTDPGAGR
jgi:valine dehydrogenase (NAD+)